MAEFVDFDAAWAEQHAEPLRCRLFGQVWELPAVLPAGAALAVARLQAAGRSEQDLNAGEILDVARGMFPAGILDAWLAKGLDTDQLLQLIAWAGQEYQQREVTGPGEARAPKKGAKKAKSGSSSAAGRSSKRTSGASTRSRSPKG